MLIIGAETMNAIKLLRNRASRRWVTSKTTLYECRNCGQKFAVDVNRCFTCESDEIAHYEF
jgi:predicted Zn-ribbon and HTH transcriptional regulator